MNGNIRPNVHYLADSVPVGLLYNGTGASLPVASSFYFESLDFAAVERKLNAYYAEFQPLQPGKARLHHHTGVEFLSILRGTLELHIGDLHGYTLKRP